MYDLTDCKYSWLGKIPSEWKFLKVKDGFFQKKSKAYQEDPVVLSLARSGVKVRDISTNEGQLAASYFEYNPVEPGDMLLNPMDLVSGANCSLSDVEGVISPAYVNLKNKPGFNPKYYDYYFKIQYWTMAFFSYGKGVSFENRWTLNNDTLMNFPLLVPTLAEQNKIVNYLNKECKKIDNIAAKVQEEVNTLESLMNSLIYEKVIGGLNSSFKHKNVTATWFESIPENWSLAKINDVYTIRNVKVSDRDYEPLSVTMKGIVHQLETAAKTNAHDDRKLVKKGDFVINSRSDRRGSCGISEFDGSVSLINTVLAPKSRMCSDYYNWLFHTEQFADEFYKWGHGIVDDLWTTGWQEMKKIVIPFPPLDEQKLIADYLNEHCKKISRLIKTKQEQLELLENTKRSIIFEYITGKKEVSDE